MGRLFCGDNRVVLREYFAPASVDLIYLDPPFSSNRDYNQIFRDESGNRSPAQMLAFDDTWHWQAPKTDDTLRYLTDTDLNGGTVPTELGSIIAALVSGLRKNPLTAYLVEMAVRLVEMHYVLKPTGSLYLHCDPTTSHYLKVVLDAVFGPKNFRSEIVWKRSSAHSDGKQGRRNYGHIHDELLFYTKGDTWTWNSMFTPHDPEYLARFYRHIEPQTGRRYRIDNLTAAKPGGDTSYEWHGVKPYKGRYWAYSRANMEKFEREERLIYSKSGIPQYKRYLDEMPGVPLQDVWTDINPVAPKKNEKSERVGFQTQKPLALLERIISVSSNPGDMVLDPFCGCGTAIIAAHKLGREWAGIDIAWLAIGVMKARMREYGIDDIAVENEPTEMDSLRQMIRERNGGYKFQFWALNKVLAMPIGGIEKKGRDRGIDGVRTFSDAGGQLQRIIYSAKSGHITPGMVRELIGVMKQERAAMGIFLTVERPTEEISRAARVAGSYQFAEDATFPRVQIVTAEDLLAGRLPDVPAVAPPAGFRRTSLAGVDRRRSEQMILPKVTDPLLVDKAITRDVEQIRARRRKAIQERKRQQRAGDATRARGRSA
jgi:DNA modification methylase